MTQYIDKAALVAEIQKLYDKDYHYLPSDIYGYKDEFLAIIDELEAKEVDLEKEICSFFSKNPIPYEHITDWPLLKNCAIHFFELGLNTQQNINIDITNIDRVIEENGVDPNSKEAKIFKESYYMALEKLKTQKGVENER